LGFLPKMMGKCDACGEILHKDKLEDWGAYILCKKCVKEKILNLFPEKAKEPEKILTIKPLSEFFKYPEVAVKNIYNLAGYDPATGNIDIFLLVEKDAERVISHEIVHHVIHKLAGLKATYLFDNLYYR